jgi:hypothetical protein
LTRIICGDLVGAETALAQSARRALWRWLNP